MNKKPTYVTEHWVEVKIWNPEHVYNINGLNYVPLRYINEFTEYSHPWVRGLIHRWRLDFRAVMTMCDMTFIRRDYIPALQMMYNHPEKRSKQKFMIDIYYNKVDLDEPKIIPSKDNLKLI